MGGRLIDAQIQPRDGATYDHARDGKRLELQHQRVFEVMKDGRWRSIAEIAKATGDGEASISARLRDFRKPRFGSHAVHRLYIERGLFHYRLVVNHKDMFA